MREPFHSIYSHGFVRAAVCVPFVRVADPEFNVERTLGLARRVEESHELSPILLVGAPLRFEGKLFNCAVAIYRGRVLGIVPKTYLPNYREFYEKRQFTSGRDAVGRAVSFLGEPVPFGNDLIFAARTLNGFALHVEICEDVWTPIPPSTYAALAGATVLANLSASNITIGKAAYRRTLCAAQSGRCLAAYLYSAAGPGESTTDLAWDGHALIYENGELLAEAERFAADEQMIIGDIDLERLVQERMRLTSFNDTVGVYREQLRALRRVEFDFQVPEGEIALARQGERFPHVAHDVAEGDERCYQADNIQDHGLMKRLRSTDIERVVIGVSGGLDSTQALIVAAKTMDRLGLPRTNILAYTMPGFAASRVTLANAHALMQALGVSGAEIDIKPSCLQLLRDIGHPFAKGEPVYDVTFENVQAGERTSHLFRLANLHNALVGGTGDLSELALGWMTYGVGDQMSHYNVNVSVPKTFIQYLIRWVVSSGQFNTETNDILQSILDTEISPELVPHAEGAHDVPAQSTQAQIGPYELQDFNLYYITRYGYRPSKVAYLSYQAWHDRTCGVWPEGFPAEEWRA